MSKRSQQAEDAVSSLDIDSLRDEHESSSEWLMRRKFLQSNCDSLDPDRLICLSRCFVNVAVYGCSYPAQVMRELNERSGGILEEVEKESKAQAKQNYSCSFVKASEADCSHTKDAGCVAKPTVKNGQQSDYTVTKEKLNTRINFVKSTETLQPEMPPQHDCGGDNTINKSSPSPVPDILVAGLASENSTEEESNISEQLTTLKSKKGPLGWVSPAHAMFSQETYLNMWRNEKDEQLGKFRKLAYEVVSLKSHRPNAIDKVHSASHRVPIAVESNIETLKSSTPGGNPTFVCHVFMDSLAIASEPGSKIKDAKLHAYESALQKIFLPHLRVVNGNIKELQASKTPFTSQLPEHSHKTCYLPQVSNNTAPAKNVKQQKSSINNKETNFDTPVLKRRFNEAKPINDFIIIEPIVPILDCTAVHTLRRSADFSQMLIEYDCIPWGDQSRCILKIEDHILADVIGDTKISAKNLAAAQGLNALRDLCWVIKTKKLVDSDMTISKDELIGELNEHSGALSKDCDNIGNKMLRKMGWSGGGMGKDGSGIAEPVSMTSVLNRQGLGLTAAHGITDEFRKCIREIIRNFVMSNDQEDLLFSAEFTLEERQVIHDESRKLNLRSKSRGKGPDRCLCVHRKRTSNQLFEHIMSCGGETPKYKLLPPGSSSHNDAGGAIQNIVASLDLSPNIPLMLQSVKQPGCSNAYNVNTHQPARSNKECSKSQASWCNSDSLRSKMPWDNSSLARGRMNNNAMTRGMNKFRGGRR